MIEPHRILKISRRVLLGATVVALVAFAYRFRFVTITPGCDSVAPRIVSARRVLVDRLPMLDIPLLGNRLRRGDIVVCGDEQVTYLAVVGGLPGDAVENRESVLWIAGASTDHPPLPDESLGTVPEGHYLLFNSSPESAVPDSSDLGFVSEHAILGRLGAVVPF